MNNGVVGAEIRKRERERVSERERDVLNAE
jgi:hypothetical protein